LAAASGCATEANTLEPEEGGGTGSGGKVTMGKGGASGSQSAGGKSVAGSSSSAFGGAAATGGAGGKGTAGNSAGGADGGSSGSGGSEAGSSQGGAGAGSGGKGGQGGTATGGKAGSTGAGGSGSAGKGGIGGSAAVGCLADWEGDAACNTCSTQTQADRLACVDILDCYVANNCGPATCSGSTDVCGPNAIQKGTAPYPFAKDVYDCLCN